jgi:hypothetical protein
VTQCDGVTTLAGGEAALRKEIDETIPVGLT